MYFIIPHYNKNIFRQRNLKYTTNYYRDNFPLAKIIVIEQNSESDLSDLPIDKHIKLKSEEFFWKSRAINEAVSQIDDPNAVIIMTDNDCILTPDTLKEIDYSNNFGVITPFDDIHFLNESQTRKYINGDHSVRGKRDLAVNRYTGGLTIFSIDTFNKLGGFDEEFQGWGGEDCAFINKCEKLDIKYSRVTGTVTHLFHPTESNNNNPKYKDNRELLLLCKLMTKDDMIEKIKHKTDYSNYIKKYKQIHGNNFSVDVVVNIGGVRLKFDNSIYCVTGDVTISKILDSMYDAGDIGLLKQIAVTIKENVFDSISDSDKWIVEHYIDL